MAVWTRSWKPICVQQDNMFPSNLLWQAIDAARNGRRTEARDLLLKVVEFDPHNEAAWMWLSSLVESLEDRIIACENVLTINPANEKVRSYLSELRHQQIVFLAREKIKEAESLFIQARTYAEKGDSNTALQLVNQALELDTRHEGAWLLVAQHSTDINQQITALEKASAINPSNAEIKLALELKRHLRAKPLDLAALHEQEGRLDKALEVYKEEAAKAKTAKEFDRIYSQITRIEGLQREQIEYVAPVSSITRLTLTWPLLYLILVLIQVGLNPFAHPALHLWLGLPWVALGSFLLALAEVRSRHIIWRKLFLEQGDGSKPARFVAALAGWFLVILPHALLILDSLNRLRNFQIPPRPF